jgi:O-antigen/teichoic acid export membrane protein
MLTSPLKFLIHIPNRKIGKTSVNTILLAIADIFGKAALFFIFVFYARSFGVQTYGYFSFAYGATALLVIIADPGINQFIIREIASKNLHTIAALTRLFIIKAVLLLPYGMVTLLYCLCFDITGRPFLFVIFMMFYFWIDSLHQFIRNIYRAQEKMNIDLISRVNERTLLLVIAIIFISLRTPLLAAFCFPLVALFSILLDIFWLRPFRIRAPLEMASINLVKIFKKTLPFTVSHIIFVIYFRVDILMLQAITGFESVGIYTAAYRIFEGTQLIPIAFAGSLYPVFSRLSKEDRIGLQVIKVKALIILMPVAIFVSIVLFVFSEEIINIFYGSDYIGSQAVLSILALGIIFNYYYMVFTYLFSALDKQGYVVIFGLIILILNIVLNLILIPIYGPSGAAAATVICELLITFIVFFLTKNLLGKIANEKR